MNEQERKKKTGGKRRGRRAAWTCPNVLFWTHSGSSYSPLQLSRRVWPRVKNAAPVTRDIRTSRPPVCQITPTSSPSSCEYAPSFFLQVQIILPRVIIGDCGGVNCRLLGERKKKGERDELLANKTRPQRTNTRMSIQLPVSPSPTKACRRWVSGGSSITRGETCQDIFLQLHLVNFKALKSKTWTTCTFIWIKYGQI